MVTLSVVGTILTGNFETANLQPFIAEKILIYLRVSYVFWLLHYFLYVGFDCIPLAEEEYNFPLSKCKFLICNSLIVDGLIYAAMAVPWTELSSLTDTSGELVKYHTGAVF